MNYSPLPSGHGLGHQIQDRPLELCRIFRATPGGAGSLFKSAETGQRVWPGHHPHAHPAGRGPSLLSSQLSSLSGWAPTFESWVQLPGTVSSKERFTMVFLTLSLHPSHCWMLALLKQVWGYSSPPFLDSLPPPSTTPDRKSVV